MNKREIEQNENIERLQRDLSILDATTHKMMSRLSTIESDISRLHSRISNFENTYFNVPNIDISKHTKEEKIYVVEFNTYTNASRDTVSDDNKEIGKTKYLNIPKDGLLIRESDFDKYRKYGGGFKSLICVGTLINEEKVNE